MFGNDTTELQDFDFWSEGEKIVYDGDLDTIWVASHKATADIIAVGEDRDELRDTIEAAGVPLREATIKKAAFDLDADKIEYPNLP